jgi:two-component system response regulator HydG
MSKPRLLLVEDDRENALMLKEVLSNWGYGVTTAFSGPEALRFAKSEAFEVVLADIRMPDVGGLQVLREIRQLAPLTQVVMMTGFGSVDTAVEAMKAGAFDYVSKPFKFDEIRLTLSRALEHHRALAIKTESPKGPALSTRLHLVGHSRAMAELYKTIAKVAPGRTTVLIQGESGTGKELVARAIHGASRRAGHPIIKVNCGALSPSLVDSELFGHERGAFTGATQRRIGRFELADRGTLFLDEVAEVPAETQVKLLRVLQEREFERVGGERTLRVDVRLIAATHRDLDVEVAAGRFRPDLYYRLNVFPVIIPPLRERPEDLGPLAQHFVAHFARRLGKPLSGISRGSFGRLRRYAWPGNIRELQNVIERACVLATGPVVDVPEPALGAARAATWNPSTLEDAERAHILRTLEQTGWRVEGEGGAADLLGLRPSTLRSRLQKLGIERSDRRQPAGRI